MAVTILALATVTPFAEAGTYRHRTGNSDYYRGSVEIRRSYPAGGYSYRRGSGAGPVLAGFFGGLLLGAVLTNHSHQVIYRDPYCDRDFYSRQAFIDHCNTYHRSREVRIVRYSSGRDYYDACRDRGYYNDGRTYDRDNGRYDGNGDWNNRDDRGDRDYRDDGGWQKDRDDCNSRDHRSHDHRGDYDDEDDDGN